MHVREEGDQAGHAADQGGAHLDHQLGLLRLELQDDGGLAGAHGVAEFQVRAAPAGQHQHARLAVHEGAHVVPESALCDRVFEGLGVLLWGPLLPVRIDLRPAKAVVAGGRISEVVDLVTSGPEGCEDGGLMGVSPGGCEVDFHGVSTPSAPRPRFAGTVGA